MYLKRRYLIQLQKSYYHLGMNKGGIIVGGITSLSLPTFVVEDSLKI